MSDERRGNLANLLDSFARAEDNFGVAAAAAAVEINRGGGELGRRGRTIVRGHPLSLLRPIKARQPDNISSHAAGSGTAIEPSKLAPAPLAVWPKCDFQMA